MRNEWTQWNLWENHQWNALGDYKHVGNNGLLSRGRRSRCGEVNLLEKSQTRSKWVIKGLIDVGVGFGVSDGSERMENG